MLFKARNSVIKFFDYFYLVISEARYEASRRKWLKLLTPNQMLQRLPVVLAQVKVGDKSENLLNENFSINIFFVSSKRNYQKNV